WWPTGSGRSYSLGPALSALEPFKDKLLFMDGLEMTTAIERAGGSNGHDKGTGHSLVCRPLRQGPSGVGEFGHLWDGSAGGISIDQAIGDHFDGVTRFKSLEFGVRAEGIRQSLPSRISYRDAFMPVIPMHRPGEAFDRVFGPLTGDAAAQAALRRRRELVLGSVRGDLQRLRPNLSTADARRVEAHVASIDDIASRLDAFGSEVCDVPTRADSGDFPTWGRLQMDLMAKALECDQTRVASIQWSNGQSGVRFEWLGHRDGHHSISHKGISDAAGLRESTEIDEWYAQQFAYFLGLLEGTEVGDGQTLLDYTTVVWCGEQEQGIGNIHRFRRLPWILAGGGGGFFDVGRFVDLGGKPHGELFVSLMQMMGMSATTFGDPDFCSGPIDALHA
ncbi:MAG: DUF1552 domain-containing protein, partial [Myxococcota bacterium]